MIVIIVTVLSTCCCTFILYTETLISLQDGNFPCFTHIAAMYSELVCVGADGKLYQWKWEDPLPYQDQGNAVYHPRATALGLIDEKVVSLSASSIRASALTESGKVINVL